MDINIPVCLVCEEEIKNDVYMYDNDDIFCSDDCKEVDREDEIEREGEKCWRDSHVS
jgi:hypothetical protein